MNIKNYLYDRFLRSKNHVKQPVDTRDYQYKEHFPISGSSQLKDVINDTRHLTILDQRNLEACTAYTLANLFRDLLLRDGVDVEISPTFNWYMAKKRHGYPLENKGVYMRWAISSIYENGVLPLKYHSRPFTFNNYPSNNELALADMFKTLHLAKELKKYNYYWFSSSELDSIIDQGHFVAFSIPLNTSFYGNTNGFIEDKTPNQYNHAMLIVGRKTFPDGVYYKVLNSWGKSFGQNGYCYIPRNYMHRRANEYCVIRKNK